MEIGNKGLELAWTAFPNPQAAKFAAWPLSEREVFFVTIVC
jgi:hypothetical protein